MRGLGLRETKISISIISYRIKDESSATILNDKIDPFEFRRLLYFVLIDAST